jgi:pentose-5-phosphate-3-epimerase
MRVKQIGFISILWTAFCSQYFLRNASFAAINKTKKENNRYHLMIVDPDRYIKNFCTGTQHSIHYEACTHLHRTPAIKEGMKAGVAINPY